MKFNWRGVQRKFPIKTLLIHLFTKEKELFHPYTFRDKRSGVFERHQFSRRHLRHHAGVLYGEPLELRLRQEQAGGEVLARTGGSGAGAAPTSSTDWTSRGFSSMQGRLMKTTGPWWICTITELGGRWEKTHFPSFLIHEFSMLVWSAHCECFTCN